MEIELHSEKKKQCNCNEHGCWSTPHASHTHLEKKKRAQTNGAICMVRSCPCAALCACAGVNEIKINILKWITHTHTHTQVGMRILEVNGTSLLGATHQEAVNALREAGNQIQAIVCKGYDKSSLIHSIGSNSSNRLGSRASDTGSELSQSVSSLDRDDGGIDDYIHAAAAVSNFFVHSFCMRLIGMLVLVRI